MFVAKLGFEFALSGFKDWALSTVNGDLDSFDDILADDGASQAMEY